jgi:hypothetical protein
LDEDNMGIVTLKIGTSWWWKRFIYFDVISLQVASWVDVSHGMMHFYNIDQTCGDPGISGFPEGDNIFSWIGTIKGSTATVYEGLASSWLWSSLLTTPSNLPLSNLTRFASIPMLTNMATYALIFCRINGLLHMM